MAARGGLREGDQAGTGAGPQRRRGFVDASRPGQVSQGIATDAGYFSHGK